MSVSIIIKKVQKALTSDLLKPEYLKIENRHPLQGHCYVASEAVYHLLGGKKAGLTPVVVRLPNGGGTHWWLQDAYGYVIDPTSEQFGGKYIPYEFGIGTGFLTKLPSKRAQIVIGRIK